MPKRYKYDWVKTLKKVLLNGAFVVVSGLLVVYQDNPKWLALIPLFVWARDFLKHKIQVGWMP